MRASGLCFFLPFLLLLVVAGVVSGQGQALTSRLDLSALYSLRASLGLRAADWPRKVDPCAKWVGITCQSGRVVALDLSGCRRTRLGRQNPVFAVEGLRNLTALVAFKASGFLLLGSIPAWFGSDLPTGFNSLDLGGCGINGSIPSSLASLRNLTTLVLSRNRLDGLIPESLGSLGLLKRLDLGSNLLSGKVPERLGNLSSLQDLDLSGNFFNDTIPSSVWAMPSLQSLNLSFNRFTGTLQEKATVFSVPDGVVDLSANLFYGNISSGLFARLRFGNISDNYFQGKVPSAAGTSNLSVQLNCFMDIPGQRNATDCIQFYSDLGMVPSPPMQEDSGRQRNWRLVYILVGVLGGLLLLAVLLFLLVLCFKRRAASNGSRRQPERDVGSTAISSTQGPPPKPAAVTISPVGDSFTYDQLLKATGNFSDGNLIKYGHTGDLYLGTLEEGAAVVVKRIDAEKASKEWYKAELDFFARVSHTRMVPFIGHCLEKEDEKLLVYKYMPSRDLSNALYRKPGLEEEGLQSLDWITRLKIATGVAEALSHLHHDCSPPIVHRDIQASSILLDDKFEVRLGSVSEVCTQEGEGSHNVISRLFRISQSAGPASTSGTIPATCAYDVYCLGKVLLELVTGKLGISGTDDSAAQEFIEQTMPMIRIQEKELLTNILDPSLIVDEDLLEEVWAMAIVAKSCLNPKASKRPSAKIILEALNDPLRVIRYETGPGSARLRTTSSRGSWNAALFGSWRSSDKEVFSGPARELTGQKSSETAGSQGSIGEQSFNRRKPSKEIFPEPSGSHDIES